MQALAKASRMEDGTLLAEAFPLCFLALYCHSLRGFGCSRFVLVVSVPRSACRAHAQQESQTAVCRGFSSAQKQPKQNASSQNREENGSTTLRNTREKPLLAAGWEHGAVFIHPAATKRK